MSESQTQYFALITRPQRELSIAEELRDDGYVALVPTEWKWPGRRARRQEAPKPKPYPKFTRYVFLGFKTPPDGSLWQDVLNRDDVSGVIGWCGVPAQLSKVDVWRVMQHETSSVQTDSAVANQHRSFKIGDEAEIIEGPFAGHLVRIEDIVAGNAKILMGLFGRPHRTQIALDNLDAA